MGHLPRHFAPGLVPFVLGEYAVAFRQVVHHTVVGVHKAGNLIVVLVFYVVQTFGAGEFHTLAEFDERVKDPVEDM